MKRALLIAAVSVGLTFGFAGVATADRDDDDHDNFKTADHTTYTSESEDSFACGCPRRNVCRVHATISNVGNSTPEVDIQFFNGTSVTDLVTVFVPDGTSLSLTQMMGTRDDASIDDIIIFNPRAAQSANPLVAWVSIERLGRGRKNESPPFGCTTIPYNG